MSDAKVEPKETARPAAEPKPFYLRPRFIVAALAALVFLVLILQNMESVLVEIFFWKVTAPAALVYFFFVVAGFVAARLTLKKDKSAVKSG
ncbi:MAG: hypothetical protein JJ974_09365 [Phycisphaerales bacterium]|nr:hypothetical protein [Phycisphaerales bacterium]